MPLKNEYIACRTVVLYQVLGAKRQSCTLRHSPCHERRRGCWKLKFEIPVQSRLAIWHPLAVHTFVASATLATPATQIRSITSEIQGAGCSTHRCSQCTDHNSQPYPHTAYPPSQIPHLRTPTTHLSKAFRMDDSFSSLRHDFALGYSGNMIRVRGLSEEMMAQDMTLMPIHMVTAKDSEIFSICRSECR